MTSLARELSGEMLASKEKESAGGDNDNFDFLDTSSGGQEEDGEVLPLDMLE